MTQRIANVLLDSSMSSYAAPGSGSRDAMASVAKSQSEPQYSIVHSIRLFPGGNFWALSKTLQFFLTIVWDPSCKEAAPLLKAGWSLFFASMGSESACFTVLQYMYVLQSKFDTQLNQIIISVRTDEK